MNDLIAALLKAGAPILSAVIGGPVVSTATAVIGALADALKVPATPDAITKELATNPQAAAIVQQIEKDKASAYIEELNARLKDVQNARESTVNLVKEGSSIAWGAPAVSVLVVVLYAIALVVFMTKPVALNEVQSTILNILLGTLTAAFTQVVNYWLGSSHGSATKDAALKTIAAK